MLTRKQQRAAETSTPNRENEHSLQSYYAIEQLDQGNDDEAEDTLLDDDDYYEDEDASDNDNRSESFPIESQALMSHEHFSDSSNTNDMFLYGDTMHHVDSAFFIPNNTSVDDLGWDLPIPMSGYLSNGHHLLESESSSSLQPTPPSGDDPAHVDIDMLGSGGGYGDLLHSEATDDASWIVSNGFTPSPPSPPSPESPSQTTLILENVHPDALKSVMSILIETNTKMTMQRHQRHQSQQ
jgi:hypothetical protein